LFFFRIVTIFLYIGLDDLWTKKEELEKDIEYGTEEINKLQSQIKTLNEKLTKANEKLLKKEWSRNEFEKIITKTQAAYLKIFETSQKILNI
jgi:Sjoegren syndrome nuclear autoantigen 1